MKTPIAADDAGLVARLSQADPLAFEEIYRQYSKDLYRFARKNIQSTEDCEEIIQDIFESLWRRRESLNVISLRHYLYNAVRYKVIRYFQHQSVKRRFSSHYTFFEELYDSIHEGADANEDVIALLEEKMAPLPERCRIAFGLRLHENLSNGEIAERMNISKKTVEVYMFKAFQYFRGSYHEIFR